jgi:hypothetical protein
VTTQFLVHRRDGNVIQMPNVRNVFAATLDNWCAVAADLGLSMPMQVEAGAIGIAGFHLPLDRRGGVTRPIRKADHILRRSIAKREAAEEVVQLFVAEHYDQAGVKI